MTAATPPPGYGLWICADGVEGAGKTTLVRALADELGAVIAPEFSLSATGRALHSAVRKAPHYISASTWGQSLAFIGDFHETYETAVLPALASGLTVISDRGWLSKYAYQAQVLVGTFTQDEIDRRLFLLLDIPRLPDLTFFLDTDIDTLRARLIERDGSCTPERTLFIEGARSQYLRFIGRLGQPDVPTLRVKRLPSERQDQTLTDAISVLRYVASIR